MRKPISHRIADLAAKRAPLDAELKRLQVQQTAAERKADTRRKILIGAIVMADPDLRAIVTKMLAERLTRDDERALFGLPPKASTA
jgi:hypothetical protein